MHKVEIEANVPGKDGGADLSGKISVDYPDYEKDPAAALKEAEAAYGAAAILSNAFANWRITLQSNMRTGLKKGETSAQLQARLGASKMGVAAAGIKVDPVQAFLAKFETSTPDEQAKMLAELKNRAAKK